MKSTPNGPSQSHDLAGQLWADMRDRWKQGQQVRVEEYLLPKSFPREDADLILDLIYGEFALREQAGETPTVAEYCRSVSSFRGPNKCANWDSNLPFPWQPPFHTSLTRREPPRPIRRQNLIKVKRLTIGRR